MLTQICKEINNWFVKSQEDVNLGTFQITNGVIAPLFGLKNGQYYRIIGSTFNDGVHKYGDTSDVLTDETFEGGVWYMSVPKEVLALSTEISTYVSKYGEASPYTSESFGGYSYSKSTDANGNVATWQNAFSKQLNAWRKL